MFATLRRSLTTPLIAAIGLAAMFAMPARAEVKFETNTQKAMARAAREKKPIMLDVYTDWCGWCKKLDADVYAQPDVSKYINANFVPLKVNPEKTKADKAFVDKYSVQGFPTILFVDAKGKEFHRIVGYKPAPDFLKDAQTARAKAPKAAVKRAGSRA